MHNVSVKMKDGTKHQGPLWIWRPMEGWFELAGVEPRIHLRDVESAVHLGQRVTLSLLLQDVDLLERAKSEGWTGV